jgi:lipoyl-dependent peroxiredoxin
MGAGLPPPWGGARDGDRASLRVRRLGPGKRDRMALARREATVTWTGTLGGGEGTLVAAGGEHRLPVDWAARSEAAEGTTSPEELLAAADAGCYAMALALALTRNGTPAERLEVRGSCELDRSGDEHEYEITGLRLDVTASVPGLDEAAFAEVAERADRECPISNALRGRVPVQVRSRLQAAA